MFVGNVACDVFLCISFTSQPLTFFCKSVKGIRGYGISRISIHNLGNNDYTHCRHIDLNMKLAGSFQNFGTYSKLNIKR